MELQEIRLLNDRVLVAVDRDPVRTSTGLLLGVTDHTERPVMLRGTVLAAGPGKWTKRGVRKPMDARPGMRVAINRKHCSLELEERNEGEAGREILIVRDEHLAVEC